MFPGCAGKIKIYIEDPASTEIIIDKTPCRKLGILKNGGEQAFTIGNEEAKIYVIADRLSKGYWREYYQLPEGEEDIVLTGQIQMTPGGNMFRFDDNDSSGIQKFRKKGTVIGVIVLIFAIAVGIAVGRVLSGGMVKDRIRQYKEFSSNGMTITLGKDFSEDCVIGFTSCYRNKDVCVLALREAFADAEGLEDLTLQEYGELVLEANELFDVRLNTFEGILGFEYDYEDEDGHSYHDRSFLYKTDDSFWLIQFIAFREVFSQYEVINGWANSVRFD